MKEVDHLLASDEVSGFLVRVEEGDELVPWCWTGATQGKAADGGRGKSFEAPKKLVEDLVVSLFFSVSQQLVLCLNSTDSSHTSTRHSRDPEDWSTKPSILERE